MIKQTDTRDNRILNILLDNSRLSYRKIARKAGCSVVTIINRVRELEKAGIIQNYSATVDYEKLGYDVTAMIQLRICKGKLFEVEKKIANHPHVFAVYDITGNFDSLVLTKFKSRKSLDLFLKRIQTFDFVERTETSLVLNTIIEKKVDLE